MKDNLKKMIWYPLLAVGTAASMFFLGDIARMKIEAKQEARREYNAEQLKQSQEEISPDFYRVPMMKDIYPIQWQNLERSAENPDADFANNFDYIPEMTNSPKQRKQNPYRRELMPTNPITPSFIEKIVAKESKHNPDAISKSGARGLMQIMEPTWHEMTEKVYGRKLSYEKAFDPEINRKVGTAYLSEIDDILTNSLPDYENMPVAEQQKHIAAAYNGGVNKLVRKKGNISEMPKETRDYVKVIANNS